MSKKTGIVMKITEKYIVLMMPDGSYKNVKRAYDHTPLLGERMDAEMSSFPAASLRWISVGAAAVCLLLAVLLISGITQIGSNPTFTVALDINPSMEIQLNYNNKIIGITALNDDADNVLKNVDYKNKYLGEALSDIIDSCAVHGYLSQEVEGLIYVSVIPAEELNSISKEDISASLQTALDSNNVNAVIDIKDVRANVLDEAHKLDMSVNRYIIYSELAAEGAGLSAEQAGRMSMSELKAIAQEHKNKNNGNSSQEKDNKGNGKEGNDKNEIGDKGNAVKENDGKENGKGGNNKQENGKGENNTEENSKGENNKGKPEKTEEEVNDSNGSSKPDKNSSGSSKNANNGNNPNENINSNSGNNSGSSGNGGNNSNNGSSIGSSSSDENNNSNTEVGNSNNSGNADSSDAKGANITDITEGETDSSAGGGEKGHTRIPKVPVKK